LHRLYFATTKEKVALPILETIEMLADFTDEKSSIINSGQFSRMINQLHPHVIAQNLLLDLSSIQPFSKPA
jgi:hypothetical protein